MKFSETSYLESSPTVDAANGVLRGVKLLGLVSKNGRRYEADGLRRAVGLYEGRHINVNHPKRNESGEDRQFEAWVGVSRNPEFRPDGIYGDVHLRQKSPH